VDGGEGGMGEAGLNLVSRNLTVVTEGNNRIPQYNRCTGLDSNQHRLYTNHKTYYLSRLYT
jgi:hypothetical protein